VLPWLQSRLDADILFLQESNSPNCKGSVYWNGIPSVGWGSAVVVATGSLREIPIAGYDGWVIGGELLDSGLADREHGLYAFSVHSPTGTSASPRRSYVEESLEIVKLIKQQVPSDAELVIGGDFNFLSLGHRQPGEVVQTSTAEKTALQQFVKFGLASCWAASHAEQPLPQTLRWSRDTAPGKTTPFHCDGILVPMTWSDRVFCEVLTSDAFKLSDHNPVAAWISREG